MFYEIIELEGLSGSECTIYSIVPAGSNLSIFREFIERNKTDFAKEVKDITERLTLIGKGTGARVGFFKEFEGRPGDGVCALFDLPGNHLRLYCIRFGMTVIILGGGGPKGKETRNWQDDPMLSEEVTKIMAYADDIGRRLVARDDLRWTKDYKHLEGDLKNYGKEEME